MSVDFLLHLFQGLHVVPDKGESVTLFVKGLGHLPERLQVDLVSRQTHAVVAVGQQVVLHLSCVRFAIDVRVRGSQLVRQVLDTGCPLLNHRTVTVVSPVPDNAAHSSVGGDLAAELLYQVVRPALGRSAREEIEPAGNAATFLVTTPQAELFDLVSALSQIPRPHLVGPAGPVSAADPYLPQASILPTVAEDQVHPQMVAVADHRLLVLEKAFDFLLYLGGAKMAIPDQVRGYQVWGAPKNRDTAILFSCGCGELSKAGPTRGLRHRPCQVHDDQEQQDYQKLHVLQSVCEYVIGRRPREAQVVQPVVELVPALVKGAVASGVDGYELARLYPFHGVHEGYTVSHMVNYQVVAVGGLYEPVLPPAVRLLGEHRGVDVQPVGLLQFAYQPPVCLLQLAACVVDKAVARDLVAEVQTTPFSHRVHRVTRHYGLGTFPADSANPSDEYWDRVEIRTSPVAAIDGQCHCPARHNDFEMLQQLKVRLNRKLKGVTP